MSSSASSMIPTSRYPVTPPLSPKYEWHASPDMTSGGLRRSSKELDWELNLRLEERRKERARIARELHDTFLQSVQG